MPLKIPFNYQRAGPIKSFPERAQKNRPGLKDLNGYRH
jgi:hypothetical protein